MDNELLQTEYSPLIEKAVRDDGTIGLKVIGSGWGSSGYYSPDVLERDIPSAFPPGTFMFWNHPTATEEAERPEGDLSNLAAILTSTPQWQESGAQGPGVYADAKVFGGYKEAIDEIGEHIGVSIRGRGKSSMGEADGKEGRIIDEVTDGLSVDFVTSPGAGGAIIQVFEAAPNNEPLPDVNIDEAANVGEWFESQLHKNLTVLADDLFGDGRLNREERMALSHAVGQALGAFRESLKEDAPTLYNRAQWVTAPTSADLEGVAESENNPIEEGDNMEEELQEAQSQLAERDATIARLQERLLLQEAQTFVAEALVKAELPDMTRERLAKQLQNNPPIADGKIDEAKYKTAIEAAVTEAQAEIAAITGGNGQITGQGTAPTKEGATLEEAKKREDAALALIGYGGSK